MRVGARARDRVRVYHDRHRQRGVGVGHLKHQLHAGRDHDDGRAGGDDVVDEHVEEVGDVHEGEAVVVLDEGVEVLHDQQGVGDVGQDPAPSLFEELLEGVGAVRRVVGERREPQAPAVDHHQRRHPAVFACVT